jgi:hypothetical protein
MVIIILALIIIVNFFTTDFISGLVLRVAAVRERTIIMII